ncbi:MAG: hypothetical protein ACJ8GN_04975 [Longimicrobiaceae bacterium]
MKKLKLNLDQLTVDTFAIAADDGRGGTVEGFYLSANCATDGLTCNGPVGGSCGGGEGQSCAPTLCKIDGCYGSAPCEPDDTGTGTGPIYTGPDYPSCNRAGWYEC